jgi:hypothetical protein
VNVVFRLAYGVGVAIFYILFVVFGQRTFISEPDTPAFSGPASPGSLYCVDRGCFRNGEKLDPADDGTLSTSEREYVREWRDYFDDRENYSRFVFLFGAMFGLAAIAAGVVLYRRVEGLPVGLVLGGIGVAIYGWVESTRDEGQMDNTFAFVAAAIGFIVLVAAGYWFLGGRERRTGTTAAET